VKIKRALIIPDCHIPFEDLRAYDLCLEVASYLGIHEIVILGDYLDFYAVQSHPKDPDIPNLIQREIECGISRLDELDKLFPKANKVFICGNHCYRLDRYLRDRAPELFGLIQLPRLLGLHERDNWTWVPYGPEQKYRVLSSKLYSRHEPIGPSAKTTAQRGMCSIVFGHIHSIQEHQVVSLDGSNFRAMCPGWLGNKNHKVFSYVKNHAQWSEGFGIANVLENGEFFYNTCHIIHNKTHYNGKLFKV